MTLRICLSFLLFLFTSCVSNEPAPSKNSMTVMTYNVENLFDTEDDPDKEDETYLPIEKKQTAKHRAKCAGLKRAWWRQQCLEIDWSESKLDRKMGRLADVILQVRAGQGPDVLIVQEVENKKVLEALRTRHLQKANYAEALLLEGPDQRGIDVGILSRLPLIGKPQLHEVKLDEVDRQTGKVNPDKPGHPTRGILQAQFKLPSGDSLYVLGVHFPSQGSPTPARKKAMQTLKQVLQSLPKEAFVVVGGDFNITTREDAEVGFFKDLSDQWLVSHQVGCDQCKGTHNYRGDWSFLDVMLFSKNFLGDSWILDKKSIRVPNESLYQSNYWGGPARFDGGRGQRGVSDHWPLAADIVAGSVK